MFMTLVVGSDCHMRSNLENWRIGFLKTWNKKFELHLAFIHECLLVMQGQAYLEMCLDGGNLQGGNTKTIDSSSRIIFGVITMQSTCLL
jgi:hypothetical protein